MADKRADPSDFRAWLVRQLKVARWSSIPGESRQELADRLGVRADVLAQAARERAQKLKQQGKVARQLGSRSVVLDALITVDVPMPPAVHKAWVAWCDSYRVTQSLLLRSLIHHFLLAGRRPMKIGPTWLYGGVVHKTKATGRHHAKTRITRAAQLALDDYANRWMVTATGIVRGIIADALEGRGPKRLQVVTVAELWGDAAKYLKSASIRSRSS
jgi:hypothetical protein